MMEMAYTLKIDDQKVYSLDEFLEVSRNLYDPDDVQSVVENAWAFKRLSNNLHFIRDMIHKEIDRLITNEVSSVYVPNSIILCNIDKIGIRVNLWEPAVSSEKKLQGPHQNPGYHYMHDHNFNLLTIGLHGPGYKTNIYEYDRNKVTGYQDEKVEINFLEQTYLPKDKIMVLRSGKDIHDVIEPVTTSISMNLVLNSERERVCPQYEFDVRKKEIVNLVFSSVERKICLMEYAGYIGGENTVDRLFWILENHFCAHSRISAYNALEMIDRKYSNSARNKLSKDDIELLKKWHPSSSYG